MDDDDFINHYGIENLLNGTNGDPFSMDFVPKTRKIFMDGREHELQESQYDIIKLILLSDSPEKIANNIMDSHSLFKECLFESFLKEIKNEALSLSSCDNYLKEKKNESYFANFKIEDVSKMCENYAPNWFKTFKSIFFANQEDSNYLKNKLPFYASLALYNINKTNSGFQFMLGLTLKKCGVSTEALDLLNSLGVCLSPKKLTKKIKTDLCESQSKAIHWKAEIIMHQEKLANCVMKEEAFQLILNAPLSYVGTYDNLNLKSGIRHSRINTGNNQSIDWTAGMLTKCRITGNELCNFPLYKNVKDIPIQAFEVSNEEYAYLYERLIYLCSYIINKRLFNDKFDITEPKHQYFETLQLANEEASGDLYTVPENTIPNTIEINRSFQEKILSNCLMEKLVEKIPHTGDQLTEKFLHSAKTTCFEEEGEVNKN